MKNLHAKYTSKLCVSLQQELSSDKHIKVQLKSTTDSKPIACEQITF